MDRSTPGPPVHHQLPEFIQTHVHWVGDAIQPSHPLLSPSPPALNPSQHQGLFHWVNSSHEVAKVLECQLQHQSFQWTPGTDLLQDGLVGSPCSPRDSQESSPTPQFKSINSSALSFLHRPTLTSIHDHGKNFSLPLPRCGNYKLVFISVTLLLFYKQTVTDITKNYNYRGGRLEGEINRESGMDMDTRPCIKWITDKDLMYSAGNSP